MEENKRPLPNNLKIDNTKPPETPSVKRPLLKRFWWVGLIIVCIFVFAFIWIVDRSDKQKNGKTNWEIGINNNYDKTQLPIIKNLMVDFAPYNSATGKAGAFLFKKEEDKVFLEFGDVVTNPQGQKIHVLPTFEYHTDPNAVVYAVANGIVRKIDYQLDGNDYELHLSEENGYTWELSYDHVRNLTVKNGDKVTAGQKLGTVGPWSNGLGRVELQVKKPIDKNSIYDYCPLSLFNPALLEEYKQKISTLMNDWEKFKGDNSIYNETKDFLPGCLYEKLIEESGKEARVP